MGPRTQGDRFRALARAHEEEAARARWRAECSDRGDDGEAVVRRVLEPLTTEGWVVMHRRRWPGTRRADLDHVLVGPGGVVVLDSKNWRGRVTLAAGRLCVDQLDVTQELDDVADQVAAVEEVVADGDLAPLTINGAMVLVGQTVRVAAAGRVVVLDETELLRWLRSLGRRLQPQDVRRWTEVLDAHVPPYPVDAPPPVPIARPRPEPRPMEQAGLFEVQELDLSELERATRLPAEPWMVYLHPAQLAVVRRRYSGPCRVRGPAGCGKTVVALHRAAYLVGQEPGELLFLTYVRTLPRVLATLYARLSPTTAERVRFSGVHRLALQVLREAGVAVRLDPAAAETAFNRAWTQVGRPHLETAALGRAYWYDEVLAVIKGRGLHQFEQYAELTRTGRVTPLSREQRERVWDLYVRYQELLDERAVHDFADVVGLALTAAERGQAPTYRFVVVDEAQDLDLQSVRLAAALVTDPRDGLTLVGDGQQAVYPGGYTLKEAGLSVSGRSTVLTVNYRNTRQVLAAAADLVRADAFDDLEDVGQSGDRPVEVVRDGAAVLDVTASDVASASTALLARLQHDAALGLAHGDAAVLCRHRREAAEVRTLLRQGGVPVLDLEQYEGQPVDAVKVGTAKRAKGLEFARVYLPRVDSWRVRDGEAEPEQVQRERRELFVAMTRARDGLWRCRVQPLEARVPRQELPEARSATRSAGTATPPAGRPATQP